MNTTPLTDVVLRVADVGIRLAAGGAPLLQGCSFEVRAGERLTLVGESGAGKSLLAQAIMGTLPAGMTISGQIHIAGQATHGQRHATQPLWGQRIVMLPQEPWTALSPLMRLGTQVAEAGHHAAGLPWPQARVQAQRHLDALGLSHAGRQWLHQVSGGMAQRVGVACATQCNAQVLLADEPTKGLDADACEQVAQLLALAQQQGQALVTITHDLDLAQRLGGRVAVMRQGSIVEQGEAVAVLSHPQHPYTRELLAAQPRHWPRLCTPTAHGLAPTMADDWVADDLVVADALSVTWGQRAVLQGASLRMGEGDSVAVVGPSGCGKTTLGNALLGLVPPTAGRVQRRAGVAPWRFQKLYQDPVASFSAHQTLRQALDHVVRLHRLDAAPLPGWMARLRLNEALLQRKPHQVSGGELQRMAILRTLLLSPRFVFADEPTSRLDTLTQRDTMAALTEAMAQVGSALLLVSHDRHLAQRCTRQQWRVEDGRLVLVGDGL
jgi:peptide/nickel transport system ATP-binding protein